MKKLILFSLLIFISVSLYFTQSGCGKSDNPLNPSTNSGVTFTISTTPGNEGTIFLAKPNVNVKIDSAVCKLPAQNFSSTTVNADTSQVFNANETVNIGEFLGVQSGQAWTFSLYGRRADNNIRYTVNTNYTIP